MVRFWQKLQNRGEILALCCPNIHVNIDCRPGSRVFQDIVGLTAAHCQGAGPFEINSPETTMTLCLPKDYLCICHHLTSKWIRGSDGHVREEPLNP